MDICVVPKTGLSRDSMRDVDGTEIRKVHRAVDGVDDIGVDIDTFVGEEDKGTNYIPKVGVDDGNIFFQGGGRGNRLQIILGKN